MNGSIINELVLDSLSTGIPSLTNDKASMLKECCVWCLRNCQHPIGVVLQSISYKGSTSYRILWNEENIDVSHILVAYNSDDAVEFGAEAIALLLVREQTLFTAIRRAVRSTGIDYWLGYKSDDPNIIFSKGDARLEISGILEERGTNTVKNRIKKKLLQTVPTDHTFPVYISVVEFTQPKAEMVFKNAIN